ncbi:MAG: ribonuclease R [Acidobacteria bacterium]|nr:ribonuclease R [Acidobacteriota bacterium]
MSDMSSHLDLLARIRDVASYPATLRELERLLSTGPEDRRTLKRQLDALVREGELVLVRGQRYGLPQSMDLSVGRLSMNAGGFGFVVLEQQPPASSPDIYVPAHGLGDAMHGDRVVVRTERPSARGVEGRIIRTLERAHQTLVGRFDVEGAGLGFVTPFDPKVVGDVSVPWADWGAARPHDMVVVQIVRWPSPSRGALGRVVEVLGRLDQPGVDLQVVLHSHHIPQAHDPAAVAQAVRLGSGVAAGDLAGRTDFRAEPTVTIDGEHARDFDDAITIDRLPNGHFWLGVHIADVSHYVSEGSPLDRDAFTRGTSVYFPEQAVHMFPSELSTGLCSLKPQVDRLVQSCLMEVDGRGRVVRYELHDGVINSDARMTYTAVNAIVTDRDPVLRAQYAELVPRFELMHTLFEVLHERRRARGSIDFDLPEALVTLSESGEIESIVASERNVAHRIIEEFMLLANETVAAHLVDAGMPALHRVHEAPDVRKVADFEEFVTGLGHSLPASGHLATPKDFQRLIERIRGTPEERPIAALMLRTMQKARYDAASLGHFGLAAEAYTHFTSPIRRYPDLIVHRLLRERRRGAPDADRLEALTTELPEVARHSSDTERRADEAERELLQWKRIRFMSRHIGEEFVGFVTGVTPFGLFVELADPFVDGLVHVSSMGDDYYRFVEAQHLLKGENHGRIYRLGDRVAVQVVRVDRERRQIDFGLVEILEAVRRATVPTGRVRGRTVSKKERKRTQRPGRRERAQGTRGKKGRR